MADSIPKVTISELSLRYPTRKPIKAPRHSVMPNIAGIARSGPSSSCKSSTTMVEKDIIDPTERSRLPLMTTKVTPSAMIPRMAEDRTTLNRLSMVRNFGLAMVKTIMKIAKAIRMPCFARTVPICCFVSVAMSSSQRSLASGPYQSDQGHSPVDHHDLTGHVVAVLGRKKCCRPGDILRRGHAALEDFGRKLLHRLSRTLGGPDLHQVLIDLFPHLGRDDPRREPCHRDTMFCQIARARLRQRDHGEFRSAIRRDIVEPLPAGDAGGVDDLALSALGDHLAGGFLHTDHAAQTIDAHDEIPVFLGHIEEIHRPVHAGIVELDIQPAKDANRVRDHCPDLYAVCHIDCRMRHTRICARRARGVGIRDLGNLVGIDVRETDIRTFVQQRLANGAANALRRTGHDAGPPRDSCHPVHPYV